jgi:hypothetical protein
LLGAVAAGLRFNNQMIGLTGDNASYILLAHAMLTGQPYSSAESPWGYPALLTPIMLVIGTGNFVEAIPWLKLLTIVFFLASLPLLYLLFRTRHNIVLSFGATRPVRRDQCGPVVRQRRDDRDTVHVRDCRGLALLAIASIALGA